MFDINAFKRELHASLFETYATRDVLSQVTIHFKSGRSLVVSFSFDTDGRPVQTDLSSDVPLTAHERLHVGETAQRLGEVSGKKSYSPSMTN